MTTDEKIKELAEIIAEALDSLISVVPHNHVQYLEFLQQKAEKLAQKEAE